MTSLEEFFGWPDPTDPDKTRPVVAKSKEQTPGTDLIASIQALTDRVSSIERETNGTKSRLRCEVCSRYLADSGECTHCKRSAESGKPSTGTDTGKPSEAGKSSSAST